MRLGIDLGATTLVAALDGAPWLVEVAAITWSRGRVRAVGDAADAELDLDPRAGARAPLSLLESGASVVELAGGAVPVVALVGALLERAFVRAGDVDSVVLALPQGWSPAGRRARTLLAAAALAGMPTTVLVPAPLAVARGEDVLVCDVGASGCRLAVVSGERVVAVRELPLGADLLDESLFMELLRMLGEHDAASALRLEELMVSPADGNGEWRRCEVGLARAARVARERLSVVETASVAVPAPVLRELLLARGQVRAFAERDLGPIGGAARELVARAPEVRRCVIVGGAATTPGLVDVLASALEVPVVVAAEPQSTIAMGASAPVRSSARARSALASGVLAATVGPSGEIVAALAQGTIVVLDGSGEVVSDAPLRGGAVQTLVAAGDVVLIVAEELATLFDAGLRPLAARRSPIVGALAPGVAWIVVASETGPRLVTYAVAGDLAAVVKDEPLAPLRRGSWRSRRGPEPPSVMSGGGAFAVASGTVQLAGWADADGVRGALEVTAQPPWTFALEAIAPGGAPITLRAAAPGRPGWVLAPASLQVGPRVAWSGVSGEARLLRGWLVVESDTGWELRRVVADGAHVVEAGSGTVAAADSDGSIAWLVVGAELVIAGVDGVVGRRALAEPIVPVGMIGERVIGLRDGRLLAV